MIANRKILYALGAVALIQTLVLGYMVVDRVRLLKTGREITLPIVPVDPRDLFRGEYVRLGYDIGRLPASLLEGPPPSLNAPFYVVLEKSGEAWKPVKASRTWSRETSPDRVVLKARTRYQWHADATAAGNQTVRYGIESYFVPQGQGPKLEALAREKKLAALVAVDGGGNAAIKALVVEGQVQYADPLF